jgi:hypothetical protein
MPSATIMNALASWNTSSWCFVNGRCEGLYCGMASIKSGKLALMVSLHQPYFPVSGCIKQRCYSLRGLKSWKRCAQG